MLASPKRVTHYEPGGRKVKKRVQGENAKISNPDKTGQLQNRTKSNYVQVATDWGRTYQVLKTKIERRNTARKPKICEITYRDALKTRITRERVGISGF